VTRLISVAIPVRNGADALERTLAAVRAQRLDPSVSVELVVCDSESQDGSVSVARAFGAEVIEIPVERFSHGETRNLLMRRAQGEHVAFLTQDAVPADQGWLTRLLDAFALAPDVGLAYGPYRPRDDASPMVARELTEWFQSFAPDWAPRIDRLAPSERTIPATELDGVRGFFTDANGCLARAAWETVPFRAVPYAEDRALALDMLRAGYAKVYVPGAPVDHSHDYSLIGWLRRSFDEARAMRDVYGSVEPADIRRNALLVWGLVGADLRWVHAHGGRRSPVLIVRSLAHHLLRTAGALLGARADGLPKAVIRMLSLEGRGDDRSRLPPTGSGGPPS
jgi:glycosyltransferase involved in cell wall biosynthesis